MQEAQENYDNAPHSNKELMILPEVGHNDIMFSPQYFHKIKQFCHSL